MIGENSFGSLLRKYRGKRCFNQEQLAERFDEVLPSDYIHDASFVSRLESGARSPKNKDVVIALGDALSLRNEEVDLLLLASGFASQWAPGPLSLLKPIRKFIEGVSSEVEKFFGNDPSAIIGLEDDGVFYAMGLYQHFLNSDNNNITFTSMDCEGNGLDEEKIRERKVLVVDNDIITGGTFNKAMGIIEEKTARLGIKGVRYAVMSDRLKRADFCCESDYPASSIVINIPISRPLQDEDIKRLSKSLAEFTRDISPSEVPTSS